MKSAERGMVLLFRAFALPGLLAFLALVVNGGLACTERRGLQNTADAAALAGAITLHSDSAAAAEADAEQLVDENTDDLTSIVAVANANAGTVTVTVRANADSIFSGSERWSLGAARSRRRPPPARARTRCRDRASFAWARTRGRSTQRS